MRDVEKENEELAAQVRELQQAADDGKRRAEEAEKEVEAAHKAVQAAKTAAGEAQREFESRLALEVAKVREQEQARYNASKEQDMILRRSQSNDKLAAPHHDGSPSVRPAINPYAQHSAWAKVPSIT
jgi:hypothetical protein